MWNLKCPYFKSIRVYLCFQFYSFIIILFITIGCCYLNLTLKILDPKFFLESAHYPPPSPHQHITWLLSLLLSFKTRQFTPYLLVHMTPPQLQEVPMARRKICPAAVDPAQAYSLVATTLALVICCLRKFLRYACWIFQRTCAKENFVPFFASVLDMKLLCYGPVQERKARTILG